MAKQFKYFKCFIALLTIELMPPLKTSQAQRFTDSQLTQWHTYNGNHAATATIFNNNNNESNENENNQYQLLAAFSTLPVPSPFRNSIALNGNPLKLEGNSHIEYSLAAEGGNANTFFHTKRQLEPSYTNQQQQQQLQEQQHELYAQQQVLQHPFTRHLLEINSFAQNLNSDFYAAFGLISSLDSQTATATSSSSTDGQSATNYAQVATAAAVNVDQYPTTEAKSIHFNADAFDWQKYFMETPSVIREASADEVYQAKRLRESLNKS